MQTKRIGRCVLYARLSVTKEESVSIERQLRSCRSYAAARGWEVTGEFVDDGVSATMNRPEERDGWSALLAVGGFDAVVIWKVDRLARRVLDFLHADEALQSLGAGLVAVEDPIDMTSPQGRAFAVMLAVFGEMEAEAMRARVKAARAHLMKSGRFAGGSIPFGYRSVPNTAGPGRVLVKDPARVRWLAEAVELALAGETVNSIARWLTAEGAPVPGHRRSSGGEVNGRWNRQTVDGLLRNPILAGMRPYNPGRGKSGRSVDPFAVSRDDAGEPIVDEDLALITVERFAELQRLLNGRTCPQARNRSERQHTSPFLSRVVRCDACDVFMCRGTNQGHAMLYCPHCRQTLSRKRFDAYVVRRLLRERGREPAGRSNVAACWAAAGTDDLIRRRVLLSQLASLRVRRGVAGRYFDADRVILEWKPKGIGDVGANAGS
jgi:DNA invertase Pin-like site-specific DNA recombinase